MAGSLPFQLRAVIVAMLPKPSSGFRPIGVFPSLCRLWGKCRRGFAVQWGTANQRVFWAAGQYKSARDVVWRQTARSERSRNQSQHACTLLWDFYSIL
eukprot:3288947-Pyramimonas_sp.AAC.1